MPTLPAYFTGIGDWLAGSALQELCLYLLRTIPGFPPIIQTVHILGIAVVMASAVMLDLRILGLAVRSQQIDEMTQRLMPWLWGALIVNIVSGAVFVFARPMRYFYNPVFAWKMTFLIPVIILTAIFHRLSKRQVQYWEQSPQRLWTARGIALLSVGLWIMTAMAGRWIAYAEYLYFPA